MDEEQTVSARYQFILGDGPNGTAGHVSLALGIVSGSGVQIGWAAGETADDARQRITEYASKFLTDYVREHPEYGFTLTITGLTEDPVRKNEYERATAWALHDAINKLGLPPIPIFAPPRPEDFPISG